METEPKKLPEKAPAPSRKVRLTWWFGIYFLGILACVIDGILPCVINGASGAESFNESGLVRLVLFVILLFPNGLSGVDGLNLHTLPINYIIYIVHLVVTLCVKGRKTFYAMLIVLIILVSFSVVGCHEAGNYRPQI